MSDDPMSLLDAVRASSRLSQQALSNLEAWLNDEDLRETVPEIAALIRADAWDELEDAFYKRIAIGTGGIRGRIGPGPNRINQRTIGAAAQALCQFIDDYGEEARAAGVVVGHETRRGSRAFAELCCRVLAANGIRSFLFDGLRATPEISFAVRHLGATAGIQITASHNPRTDNGFKFYWSDGGQVVPPHDARFMQFVANVDRISAISLAEAEQRQLITHIGHEVDAAYLGAIRGLSLSAARSASIVFSPIHGAGSTNVLPVLQAEGFSVSTVAEQVQPDERFPTAVGDLINPEYPEVMELPVRQAEREGADVAICSDPDADRIGVAVKIRRDESNVRVLSGNQVGIVLVHYVLEQRQANGELTPEHVVYETFVTTSLISDIGKKFGVQVVDDLLVGYKFIAERIGQLPNPRLFVFAAEESLGYLAGDFVRDKDGAIASLLVAELTSWLKDRGQSVVDYLDSIYRELAYYKNIQHLVELPHQAGLEVMASIMRGLRARPPASLGDYPVRVRDFLREELREPSRYKMGSGDDMLSLVLSDDGRSRITVRPSGTEPKLKCYFQHRGEVGGRDLGQVRQRIDGEVEELRQELAGYCRSLLGSEFQGTWDAATHRVI